MKLSTDSLILMKSWIDGQRIMTNKEQFMSKCLTWSIFKEYIHFSSTVNGSDTLCFQAVTKLANMMLHLHKTQWDDQEWLVNGLIRFGVSLPERHVHSKMKYGQKCAYIIVKCTFWSSV